MVNSAEMHQVARHGDRSVSRMSRGVWRGAVPIAPAYARMYQTLLRVLIMPSLLAGARAARGILGVRASSRRVARACHHHHQARVSHLG